MPIDNEISVIETRDWIQDAQKSYLIDVRSAEEFSKYSIKPFQNVPLNLISKVISQINTQNTVILICQDGKESKKVQQILSSCGVKAYVVRGGINYWEKVFHKKDEESNKESN